MHARFETALEALERAKAILAGMVLAGWAGVRHCVITSRYSSSVAKVGQDPRSPIEIEDVRLPALTLADVDADIQVKTDLDVSPTVDLPHPSRHGSSGA